MALVYKALDQRTNEVIALKLLYPYLLTDNEAVQRFQREAKIIQSLNHPHIVALREFGEINGYFYLAMRYMAGGSLIKYFKSGLPFDLNQSLKILKQLASALDYAHARNVIHRDLKLENVLMDENGDSALSEYVCASRICFATLFGSRAESNGMPSARSTGSVTMPPCVCQGYGSPM